MSTHSDSTGKTEQLPTMERDTLIPGITEKIKQELDQNKFYRAICRNGEDLIKVLTKEGTFQFVSPSIEVITGYTQSDLLGKNILSFIHAYGKSNDKELLLIFNKDWEYRKLKLKARHKDGSKLYFESYCYFGLKIEDNELFVLICKNLTKRVLKEKQLLKSKIREEKTSALFKKINEISPNIISLWDLKNGISLYYNHKQPLGYEIKKDRDVLFSEEILHPEDKEKVLRYRQRLFTLPNVEPPSVEYRVKNKDGNYEWLINMSVVMEKDDSGLTTLLLSVTTIATEVRDMEYQLEKNLSRTAALLAYSKERIYVLNKDFNLITFNPAFSEQYFIFCGNYPEFNSSIFKFSTKEDIERWKPIYERGFRGENVSEIIEYQIGDEEYYYECTITPLKGETDTTQEICCFVRDITAIKKSETNLQKINSELDSFVYKASHDMMAPLKSILGLVKILKMEITLEEKEKYLNLIDKSVLKLENFIKDLTLFSRNNKFTDSPQKVNFEEIINESLETLAFMENANRLRVNIVNNSTSEFISQKSQLLIIFKNFISNAIKYQRLNIEQPELTITISNYEGGMLITISDNGKGIKEEYLNKVFEMFYRASEESYGSGLGLYITKQAIERLGGKIVNVESTFGQGTTFSIYIPRSIVTGIDL